MGPFTTLATELLEQCKQLDTYVESTAGSVGNISPTSPEIFDQYLLQDLPVSLQNVRCSASYLAHRLADLTLEPKDHLSRIIYCVSLPAAPIGSDSLIDDIKVHRYSLRTSDSEVSSCRTCSTTRADQFYGSFKSFGA